MRKKLAIRGHATRGKEVIGLLEMMGGKAINVTGFDEIAIYVIPDNGIIDVQFTYKKRIDNYAIFTLEEFLEKYPFKVGDNVLIPEYESEVRICKMRWDPTCQDVEYLVYRNDDDEEWYTARELLKYNDNPTNISKMKNVLAELLEHIKTTPKEELEQEFEEIKEWSNVGPTVEEFMDFCNKVNKKPKYPTTYEKCCEVIGINRHDVDIDLPQPYQQKMFNLFKLYICRDAYWKIAGEEMGLGKPWEPDWYSIKQSKFGIHTVENQIKYITLRVLKNLILVFPTEEMRDAFYENFKDLIEECKELL